MTLIVKADHISKAKQTFLNARNIYSAMICYIGLFFFILAVSLAYECIRRIINHQILHVNAGQNKLCKLNYKTLRFWMQAKARGSIIIVGLAEEIDYNGSSKKNHMGKIFSACTCSCVDEVVAEAPVKLDVMILE